MSIPTSMQPAFWQLQREHPGQCDERLLSKVWSLDLGPQKEHWELYTTYSQEELRHEVCSHWAGWQQYRPISSYTPWLWALKVYLWKYPLDTSFFERMRQEMGPMWLLHVRHAQDDWEWFYNVKDSMTIGSVALLLGLLPAHPIGQALVVTIPPVFSGYVIDEFDHKTDGSTDSLHLSQSEPGLALLHRYSDVLLHPQSSFYPRWRALLVCLANNLHDLGQQLPTFKRSKKAQYALGVLENACGWLGLKPKALWSGFDDSWIAFIQSKECHSLDTWDSWVEEFSRPPTWQEQLRRNKNLMQS